MTKSTNFDKSPGQARRNTIGLIAGVGIAAVVFLIVILSMNNSKKPPVYTLDNGSFTISTDFGETVKLSDIKSVALKNDLPAIGTKLNGLGVGSVLKGEFSTSAGDAMVYLDTSKPPFIYLTIASGLILLNDQTEAKTQALYEELNSAVKKG